LHSTQKSSPGGTSIQDETPEKQAFSEQRGTDCGTPDSAPELAFLVDRWQLLTQQVRNAILQLIGE
jgi:hypothetical protein